MRAARRSALRRALALSVGNLVLGAGLAGGLGVGLAAGPAAADPPPGCTTADMTGIMSGVSAAMAAYLFAHPDVNAFFTGLQGMPKAQVRTETEAYLNANPTVRSDLDAIRQPSRDFRTRCNLPQRPLILADNP